MTRPLFYLFLLALSATTLTAQDTFRGTIEYTYEMKGEGAEMMAAFIPEKMIVKYGEQSMMTFMEGGMMGNMMGKIIVNGESGESFVIKDDEQAVYMISKEELEEQENQEKPKVEKLDGQKDILGYACQLYQVATTQEGEETVQKIWVAPELKAPEVNSPGAGQMGGGIISNADIPGFPMEVEVAVPGTEMTLFLTATNMDKTPVEASEFERPADYEVRDFAEMMQMGNK